MRHEFVTLFSLLFFLPFLMAAIQSAMKKQSVRSTQLPSTSTAILDQEDGVRRLSRTTLYMNRAFQSWTPRRRTLGRVRASSSCRCVRNERLRWIRAAFVVVQYCTRRKNDDGLEHRQRRHRKLKSSTLPGRSLPSIPIQLKPPTSLAAASRAACFVHLSSTMMLNSA